MARHRSWTSPAVIAIVVVSIVSTGIADALPRGSEAGSDLPSSTLLVARSPDRSDAVPLDGTTLSGEVFIHARPGDGAKWVTFRIDDSAERRGRAVGSSMTDRDAPFDLVGGDASRAMPFSTTGMDDGEHRISAEVRLASSTATVTASFVVDNGADPGTDPTTTVPGGGSSDLGPTKNLWIDRSVLRSLPTSGEAWENLVEDATGDWDRADIADNTSSHDVSTFAGALYAVRTGDTAMRDRVVDALEAAVGTEEGDNALSLSRNMVSYVLAADLVGHRSARFVSWVDTVRFKDLEGRTLISTHEDRPNNWGTHAAASRIAAARYLGDDADLAEAVEVFRGYLGERNVYAGFKYGELDWQADPSRPVGVNPAGATKQGHDVDGVLPDDQRRCCGDFTWPPPKENYAWEALQGVNVAATLLERAGHPAYDWSDRAIGRAAAWLYDVAHYPAEGDDTFQPFLLDAGLGTSYSDAVSLPARHGKNMGYTDWTHG